MVGCLALSMTLPLSPLLSAGIALVGGVPAFLLGLRMVQRSRVATA